MELENVNGLLKRGQNRKKKLPLEITHVDERADTVTMGQNAKMDLKRQKVEVMIIAEKAVNIC